MHIIFLKSKVKDAEDIIRVRADAFYDEVKRYGHGPSVFDSIEKERKFILGENDRTYSYIIKCKNEIIGGMAVEDLGEGTYYLGCIFVKKEYQNYGIGSMMLRFLEKKFIDAKKWRLHILVLETSISMRKMDTKR